MVPLNVNMFLFTLTHMSPSFLKSCFLYILTSDMVSNLGFLMVVISKSDVVTKIKIRKKLIS